ncbi:hypothetical protein [Paenibacillus amylolyticus]|uniref:RCC1 domain-containing protein n=1 Tax=Paenibacillus amylolyticus TaxID=1451 RepID=UPI003EB6AC15
MSSHASLHSSLIKSNGDLYAFGYNHYGQLGQTRGNRSSSANYAPQKTTQFSNVKQVGEGNYHTLVLLENGELYAMGYNYYGQLGVSSQWRTDNSTTTPVLVMTDVKEVACGYIHSVVLKNNGDVYTFGYNGYYQSGRGVTGDTWSPTKTASGAKNIGAGYNVSFYIAQNGDLYAVGQNNYGQLGVSGGTAVRWTKVMEGVKQVDGGIYHTLVLLDNGNAMAMGYNYYGQLGVTTGNGTGNGYSLPRTVMTNVRSVAAGGYFSALITNSNDLYTFGHNDQGQLGNGTSGTTQPTVRLVRSSVKQVSCGYYHTVVVDNDGRAYAAGYNLYGQLGVSNNAGNSSPNPNFLYITNDNKRSMGGAEVVFQLNVLSMNTSFHKEGVSLIANLSHVTSNLTSYKISVNGIQRFPSVGWTAAQLPDIAVSKDLPHTYFDIGSNNFVLLEMQDDVGRMDSVGWYVTKTNQPPIVTPELSATQLHKDNVTLGGTVSDAEGDKVQYRVLLNSVQKYPSTGFTELESSPANVAVVINNSDFVVGANTLKIEATDDLGTLTTFTQIIIKTNTAPTISGDVKGNFINLQVVDPDSDPVQYRIFVNGEQLYPESDFSSYTHVPFNIQFVIPRQKIKKSQNNTVRVETLDELGGSKNWEKTFVGGYSGLLFCNATETFYSDDFGEILKYLDFGTMVAGQTTAAERVFVKNTLGYPVENIRIWVDQGELDGVNAKAEISKLDAPFEPRPQLVYVEPLEHNDKISFYVRIATTRQAMWGGMFDILVKADPRQS